MWQSPESPSSNANPAAGHLSIFAPSQAPGDDNDGFLDKDMLLKLSNSARAYLRASKTLGPDATEVSNFLEAILRGGGQMSRLDLDTIAHARLDKLLVDILDPSLRPSPVELRFRVDMSVASAILERWRSRFKAAWFDLDDVRQAAMQRNGLLKGVVPVGIRKDDGRIHWKARGIRELVSDGEGKQHFEAGQCVFLLVCSLRYVLGLLTWWQLVASYSLRPSGWNSWQRSRGSNQGSLRNRHSSSTDRP